MWWHMMQNITDWFVCLVSRNKSFMQIRPNLVCVSQPDNVILVKTQQNFQKQCRVQKIRKHTRWQFCQFAVIDSYKLKYITLHFTGVRNWKSIPILELDTCFKMKNVAFADRFLCAHFNVFFNHSSARRHESELHIVFCIYILGYTYSIVHEYWIELSFVSCTWTENYVKMSL